MFYRRQRFQVIITSNRSIFEIAVLPINVDQQGSRQISSQNYVLVYWDGQLYPSSEFKRRKGLWSRKSPEIGIKDNPTSIEYIERPQHMLSQNNRQPYADRWLTRISSNSVPTGKNDYHAQNRASKRFMEKKT